MIVVEHRIRDIVGTIPTIRLNEDQSSKPFFHWGDKKELNRWLKNKKDAYPLIWLLPTSDDYIDRGRAVNKVCEFIIATREKRKDLYNDQRYLKAFDVVLNPTTDKLIQGLTKSSISTMIDDFTIFKFPNYSEADQNFTIELWDATKLTINMNFTDNCLKNINYV